jgi:hypothetical protein
MVWIGDHEGGGAWRVRSRVEQFAAIACCISFSVMRVITVQ